MTEPVEIQRSMALRIAQESSVRTQGFVAATLFGSRGLSARTIDALVSAGIPAPEWLLFATIETIGCIPGIGDVSLREIIDYRLKWSPQPDKLLNARNSFADIHIGDQIKRERHQQQATEPARTDRGTPVLSGDLLCRCGRPAKFEINLESGVTFVCEKHVV